MLNQAQPLNTILLIRIDIHTPIIDRADPVPGKDPEPNYRFDLVDPLSVDGKAGIPSTEEQAARSRVPEPEATVLEYDFGK